jgi:hypothetical protein
MTDKMREEFEAWADEKGFCLDCKFFEAGNNFEDDDPPPGIRHMAGFQGCGGG